jgi:Tfp pilus assembly protein PilN
MSRLTIDFAPRTVRTLWYRLPRVAVPVLLLAVVLVVVAGAQLIALQHQIMLAQQATQYAQAQERPRSEKPRRASTALLTPAQALSVNTAIRKLNVPWEELLDALEEAASPRVALLELRPDIATQQIVGIAEAANSDAMFAYVRRLQGQPMLRTAYLRSHQVSELDRNKPIRFEFTATWRELQP